MEARYMMGGPLPWHTKLQGPAPLWPLADRMEARLKRIAAGLFLPPPSIVSFMRFALMNVLSTLHSVRFYVLRARVAPASVAASRVAGCRASSTSQSTAHVERDSARSLLDAAASRTPQDVLHCFDSVYPRYLGQSFIVGRGERTAPTHLTCCRQPINPHVRSTSKYKPNTTSDNSSPVAGAQLTARHTLSSLPHCVEGMMRGVGGPRAWQCRGSLSVSQLVFESASRLTTPLQSQSNICKKPRLPQTDRR
jgi:hypothetical protein